MATYKLITRTTTVTTISEDEVNKLVAANTSFHYMEDVIINGVNSTNSSTETNTDTTLIVE